jgi:hypothetical protein
MIRNDKQLGNVVQFPGARPPPGHTGAANPFDQLTVELIMCQYERGELDPRLLRTLAEIAVGTRS